MLPRSQPAHEATATSPNGPLSKSFTGFNLSSLGTEPVAFMFTNEYDGMVWPDDKKSMTLKGAAQDRIHAKMFLDQFAPGIRVMGIKSGDSNALREDIEGGIEAAANSRLLVTYFQGHSDGGSLRYVTGDRKEDGTLEGFTAKELLKMFSKLSTRTVSVVITDFCYSGNIYRLRYCLYVSADGKDFLWYETDEWRKDNEAGRKHRITAPMLHIAGSLEREEVYETEVRGGYLTNSLANLKAGPITLSRFLLGIRQGVNGHLADGKARSSNPLHGDATQHPQIYCSHMLPPDDSTIFSQIYSGTAKPFNSIFD